VSWLRKIAKLPPASEIAPEDQGVALAVLAKAAECFLLVGTVGPDDYAQLDADERAALTVAGITLRKTFAADIGIALQGAAGAAAVLAAVDGGRAATRVALQGAAARAERGP
jgi:hypothetical protein